MLGYVVHTKWFNLLVLAGLEECRETSQHHFLEGIFLQLFVKAIWIIAINLRILTPLPLDVGVLLCHLIIVPVKYAYGLKDDGLVIHLEHGLTGHPKKFVNDICPLSH